MATQDFHAYTTLGAWDRGYTFSTPVTVSQNTAITNIAIQAGLTTSDSSVYIKFSIWSSSGTRLTSGTVYGPFTAGSWYTAAVSYTLNTGTTYQISAYASTGTNYTYLPSANNSLSNHNHGVFTLTGESYYITGDAWPGNNNPWQDELPLRITYTTSNTTPTAPTLNRPTGTIHGNVTYNWTFNDPDSGDSQSAYYLRIKRRP